jgi:hypothetical protein
MKLIGHIFLKDLRRLAFPLVLWGALIVLQYIAWLSRIARAGPKPEVDVVALLWGLQLVVGWLLVARLIHEDSLTNELAMWRTRPISGARLLAGKFLGVAVMFCLWPSLLTTPWWIEFGFGPGEIVRVLAVNMLEMALLTSVAVMVAALTPDFARYVAWSIVLLLAVMVVGLTLTSSGGTSPLLLTRVALASSVLAATAAGVIALQFLRQRVGRARAIVAGSALLVALVMLWWPWSAVTMLAATGLKRFAPPITNARVAHSALIMPSDPVVDAPRVHVIAEFATTGLTAIDVPIWTMADSEWRFASGRWTDEKLGLESWENFRHAAEAAARGHLTTRSKVEEARWHVDLPRKVTPELRDGTARLHAQVTGTLLRADRGPTAALRTGAGGAWGLRQLHVTQVGKLSSSQHPNEENKISWLETEPLFTPFAILEMLRSETRRNNERSVVVVTSDQRSLMADAAYESDRASALPRSMIPVGLTAVTSQAAIFHRSDFDEVDEGARTLRRTNEASLTKVVFHKTRYLETKVVAEPFAPELIVEARLDDALRRASAENKLVLALVGERHRGERPQLTRMAFLPAALRELVRTRFVCVQLFQENDPRFAPRYQSEGFPLMAVLTPQNIVRDRFRLLNPEQALHALTANLAGRTYVDVLRDELAGNGAAQAFDLRRRLAHALLARGDWREAMEQFLWMLEHPLNGDRSGFFWRGDPELDQLAQNYEPARTVLAEWRVQALAALQRDPRDSGAARKLLAAAFGGGSRRQRVAWRDLPQNLPRENPLWWEITSWWFNYTVNQQKLSREAVEAVEPEQLFAEGFNWAREKLARSRRASLEDHDLVYRQVRWRLLASGISGVEALASTGETERARRLATEVLKFDESASNRARLAKALRDGGAPKLADELLGKK